MRKAILKRITPPCASYEKTVQPRHRNTNKRSLVGATLSTSFRAGTKLRYVVAICTHILKAKISITFPATCCKLLIMQQLLLHKAFVTLPASLDWLICLYKSLIVSAAPFLTRIIEKGSINQR